MEETTFISGGEPKLDLVYNDVWLPGLYSRRVLVFNLPSSSSHSRIVETFKKALKALVLGTPELGGQCVAVPESENDGENPWRAIKPYKGVELVVKVLTPGSFPSYMELQHRGFPVAAFRDSLLMPIPSKIRPDPQPIAKFQITFIDGGVLLSTCVDHRLTDGNGMNIIMRALGEACKQATEASNDLEPIALNTDRSILQTLHGSQIDLAQHPAYRMIPNKYRPVSSPDNTSTKAAPTSSKQSDQPDRTSNHAFPNNPPTLPSNFVPSSFRLTSESAKRLKQTASPPSSSTWISTHDAIAALLWRTTTRARHSLGRVKPDDEVTYGFPLDARRSLGLSPDWIGNCVYFCDVRMPARAFLDDDDDDDEETTTTSSPSSSLREIAAKIRKAIASVDRERAAGAMALRRRDPYSLAWWSSNNFADPRVLGTTSFYHSGLLEMDWGSAWGGAVRHFTTTDVGYVAEGFQRTSYIGPRFRVEEGGGCGGGCDVLVGADAEELRFFERDEMWNRYFERVGGRV